MVMGRTLLKVCGVISPFEAEEISKYADMLGVVIDPASKRCVGNDVVGKVVGASEKDVFLVSTSTDLAMWENVLSETRARCVQIHNETVSPDTVDALASRCDSVMVAFKVPCFSTDPIAEAEGICENIERIAPDRVLLDTGAGCGVVHDHRVSALISSRYDIMLAGGITQLNAAAALDATSPKGLDVSSGVEGRDGRKDIGRVAGMRRIIDDHGSEGRG